MKIFISGATGFVGGHLAERLIQEGYCPKVSMQEGVQKTLNWYK